MAKNKKNSSSTKAQNTKPAVSAEETEVKAAKAVKTEKASTKPAKDNKDSKKKGQNKVVKYFKDLRSEFKKVVWPSRKTVFNNTGIVLAAMAASAVFVGLLDLGLTKLVALTLQRM